MATPQLDRQLLGAFHQAGVVKSIRKPFKKLIIDPFPARSSREGSFFFEPSAQTCLTTALVS
jgi:hypothetical protein